MHTLAKAFLIAAVILVGLFYGLAHAEILATMQNQAGGRIDLSDVPATDANRDIPECQGRALAKAWDNMPDAYGCWQIVGDTVNITWLFVRSDYGHERRTYNAKSFRLTPYGEAMRAKTAGRPL